jgi:hypothetical protein
LICKLTKGKGFRGLSAYLLSGGRGQIVAGVMAGRTPRELAAEFGVLRRLNPKLGKAVAHFSLSPAPGDPELTDEQWQAIAERFTSELGFGTSPWIAVIHRDTDHIHMHVMACRIDVNGKTVSDANDYRRAEAAVRGIEADFGLIAVPSSQTNKQQRKAKQTPTTSKGDNTMTEQAPIHPIPPNPFEPGHPLHDTWPQSYEPGRDEAEIALVADSGAVVNSAETADTLIDRQRRDVRRLIAAEDYEQRARAVLDGSFTRAYRNSFGMTLYFRDQGRIADRGDRLQVFGGMDDALAAKRIVALAVAPGRGWKSITFNGSARFVELAMREALNHRIGIVAKDAEQQAILARLMAERRGGMGNSSGPTAAALAAPADPLRDILSELDSLPAQTSAKTAPAVPPEQDWPEELPKPAPVPVVGVMPLHLNLAERLKVRRDEHKSSSTSSTPPTQPRKPSGLGL